MRPQRLAWFVAIACLALGACKEDQDAAPPIRPVLSIKAQVRTTDTLEPFAGSIEPRYATDYSFRQFGRIVARFVDFGSIVKTGDELAVLDPALQILLVRDAEAAVYSAQAQLATAQAEEERQRPLLARGISPQAQFDVAVQNRETAAANLDRAHASLRRARDALSFTKMTADFDGVVTGRYAEPGQTVNAGQKVLKIARPEIREAVIAVPRALADALGAPNQPYSMLVDLDHSVTMKASGVRGVDPAADSLTRTHKVYLTLDNPPPAFRLGITISVILSRPVSPRVDLPVTALLEQSGKSQVWIVDPATSKVALRDVTIAARNDDTVSVGSGIAAGERVVTVGVHSLTPGQIVK
jgi:membrane fusion protein, multidrug efflux system